MAFVILVALEALNNREYVSDIDQQVYLGPVLERTADAVSDWLEGATLEELMGHYNGLSTGDPQGPPDGDTNLEENL